MTELLQRVQAALGDSYLLEQEIEGGGMSHLFLATEASLNRQVVIKLLPPEHASAVSAARFKQEIELAASLVHPHILPVLGAGAEEGLLYYVMPYVSGESLRQRLVREGTLPVNDAVRLLAEIADALAFAHGKGVIHRDIKPENILLEGKHAVLADFGIARALIKATTGDRLTVTGTSVGTPGYMAPEQVSGDHVDARADLYSLAIVGYEMLSGRPPFTGSSAQAVLAAHLTTPPLPLHDLRPEVPAPVSGIIQRALSKVPEDRFQSAADLADALNKVSRVPADTRSRPTTGRKWFPRTLLVAGGMVVVLIAAIWGVNLARERGQARALIEQMNPMVAQGDLDQVAETLLASNLDLGSGVFSPFRPQVAGYLSVTSDPGPVSVTLTRATPVRTFEEHGVRALGQTPIRPLPLVSGEYLVRYSAPGGYPLSRLVTVSVGDSVHLDLSLPPQETLEAGYLPVPSGSIADGTQVEGFLMGRTEVTNEEYARFVADGGYRDPSLWPDEMQLGGEILGRDEALGRLVDRTGLPGPRNWSSGQPPDGRPGHPVTGVSWYEASAYARWAGGRLPSLAEFYRAALADGTMPYPWGTDGGNVEVRANFAFSGTSPVGSYPLGVSSFGVHDMAGNVREWLADEVPGSMRRLVAGGSWRDPAYMFEPGHVESFAPSTADATIGIRVVRQISVR